ncbi:sigma-54-dependent transcriptional regulator [Oleidesulfovibrio sp.]|uniref:sigma-54-dependent transcriptional regulator n=1 Tax=Oleidesulfovibrio sp. TaxID=2909707 RepID=UPI003A848EED
MRIMIIDDNPNSLQSLSVVLSDIGHEPEAFSNPVQALARLQEAYYPLVITDIRMPEMDGLELLTRIKNYERTRYSDVVLITGHGDMHTAVEALRKGAYDYLAKPINARELAAVVERSAEHQALLLENKDLKQNLTDKVNKATSTLQADLDKVRKRLKSVVGIGTIVAQAPAMQQVLEEARIFHDDPAVPVLLEGETGTGKEVIARMIHYGEAGTETPFIAINCAAIPQDLFEAELFGHEEGAYTGSRSGGAPGKLEAADSGTIFLDEIAEMPLSLQPKLLRVLEEHAFYRVGGVKKRTFKARVICAANQNLAEMVENGTFRRDLYHRLTVGHITLPALRQRPEDIPLLADMFLQREAKRKKKLFKGISSSAMRLLLTHSWKGNVRELENAIERAVLIHQGSLLEAAHLSFIHGSPESRHKACCTPVIPVLTKAEFVLPDNGFNLDEFTTEIMHKAVEKFGGNKSKAAAYLGISRFALHRRLQK